MKTSILSSFGFVLSLLLVTSASLYAEPEGGLGTRKSISKDDVIPLGERMYRDGILPSGDPLPAVIKGDIRVDSTIFTCISCHLRSGIGSFEGGVLTPPTTGRYLYSPVKAPLASKFSTVPPRRPAYTDESLSAVLRGGVDPAGRVLDYVMPRYHLHDEEMSILISYLKNLSGSYSPGVTSSTLTFATVITDAVPKEQAELMYSSLAKLIQHKNNIVSSLGKDARKARMAESMLVSGEVAYKRLKLLRWELKGSPDSWQTQLQAYYDKEPVFALLGGISAGSWQPVHDFCEKKGLPTILPITDLPVVSDKDWYTLYFSAGAFQEGEAAAKYLHRTLDTNKPGSVLQLVGSSPRSKALANGFGRTWQALHGVMPKTLSLDSSANLQELSKEDFLNSVEAVLIWLEPEEARPCLQLLEKFYRPLFLPGGSVDFSRLRLSAALRDRVFFTYPYRLPEDEKKYDAYTDQIFTKEPREFLSKKIIKQVYSIYQVLNQALIELKGDYYRDAFLDVLGMGMGGGMGLVMDTSFPLYERLSFGPGQRYASKGCYIVQLAKGDSLSLVKKSEWVIH